MILDIPAVSPQPKANYHCVQEAGYRLGHNKMYRIIQVSSPFLRMIFSGGRGCRVQRDSFQALMVWVKSQFINFILGLAGKKFRV